MQGVRAWTFGTTLGPIVQLGMGVSTGKNQSWGSLDHPGLRAEKWDGSCHHLTPDPYKENK